MASDDSDSLPRVSVVFVTYNRPHTLVATYETFVCGVEYPRDKMELIVADDGSDSDVVAILDRIPFDVRCYSRSNRGLGANANAGIRAASGDFILFLQDDWILLKRPSFLAEFVALMNAHPEIGLVLLRNWDGACTAGKIRAGVTSAGLLSGRNDDGQRSRIYSDNPHIKRRDFHEIVGWYREGVPMTTMEDAMDHNVFAQDRYRVALLEGVEPFVHIGDRYSFNPGRRMMALLDGLHRLPGGSALTRTIRSFRRRYRQMRGREGM